MIAQETIDQVNELDLHQVINTYIELKKSGANYSALSPFTEENTPSFVVSPGKGVWKCFSSGNGGNSTVSYVMKTQNLSYPEAVKEIAGKFNIEIKYDDSDNSKEYIARADEKRIQYDINLKALELFESNSKNIDLDNLRVSKEMKEKFAIGYANDDFKNLLKSLISQGISERQLIEIGLVTKSKKGVFDFYNKRTMFPVFDQNKKLTGFSGRVWDDSKPKYINSKESTIFNKSISLYGIHLAKNEIRLKDKVNVVEGQYDVIALHENLIENTVAPLGTSFTVDQAELLKKYCKNIRLIMDGDKAGINSMIKAIKMLLPLGFTVETCILPIFSQEIKTKKSIAHDPDSILKDPFYDETIKTHGFDALLNKFTQDGVEWLADNQFKAADTTIKRTQAQTEVEKIVALIPNSTLRNAYTRSLVKKYKLAKSEIEKNIKIWIDSKKPVNDDVVDQIQYPEGANKEDHEKYGFLEVHKPGSAKNGYWFPVSQSSKTIFVQISNFTIRPLFHIYSKTDNKRLIEIRNKNRIRIIDVPSKGFVGMTQFQEATIEEGNFYFQGTKIHFQKVMAKILEMFPRCEEVKTLGWQKQGFYCFANGLAEGSFKKVDKHGMITFNEENFFLPAFSDVYKDVAEEDDLYENDRAFVYKPSSVTFEEWGRLFVRVHGDNGNIALAFFVSSLFRDFIYNIHKVFPHLFGFGGVGTGKSFLARSLNSIFHGGQPGFNLTSGTNVGFFRKLGRFRNALVWYDEYENDIDRIRFQALKASYDGLGHEKGVMSRDNRTESTKINSASIITGQYLPTRDDNSLFTRSVVLTFSRKAEELTMEDIKQADVLKDWENKGLSHLIVEVAKYRSEIEDKFQDVSFNITQTLKTKLGESEYSGRILLNSVLILTPIKILIDKLKFPFSYEQIEEQSLSMILKQSAQVSDSDALATFWKIIEFLFTQGVLTGEDLKIEEKNSLKVVIDRNNKELKTFKQPKKCLFIRFNRIYSLYLETHRKQHGENGLADTSIKAYFKSNKAFVGLVSAVSFDNAKTSAYVFDYNLLGVDLEKTNFRHESEMEQKNEAKLKKKLMEDLEFQKKTAKEQAEIIENLKIKMEADKQQDLKFS